MLGEALDPQSGAEVTEETDTQVFNLLKPRVRRKTNVM